MAHTPTLSPASTTNSMCFTWDAGHRCFSADASDLRGVDLFGRVWPDACDCGFVMQSQRTGAYVLFLLADTMEQDGEVTGWRFTGHTLHGRVITPAIDCVVFND